MYLSRLQIGIATRAGQQLLHDPYRLHQALLQAFPPDAPGGGGRVLFRVEPEVAGGVATVLVQSALPPDWMSPRVLERLPPHKILGPKRITLELRAGQKLRFRLRANPTRRSTGKRLAVLGEVEQLAWLKRKLEQGGFSLAAARQQDEGMCKGRRGVSTPPMTFLSVLFEGIAIVTDGQQAGRTVDAGIGTAKAFGFGLVSVARAG